MRCDHVEERVEIRAFIADATPIEAVATAMGDIGCLPGGRARRLRLARFGPRPRPARARRIRRCLRGGRAAGIDRDPAQAGLSRSQVREGRRRSCRELFLRRRRALRRRLGHQALQLRTIATIVGLVLGLAFASVAIIIIGTTIRMAVLAREREISIMRLVGATDAFVRLPFLIEGFAKGVLRWAPALCRSRGSRAH